MPLSWNEIRANAIKFSREYSEETREEAEAKSFWDGFFTVFGIKRRVIASFEEPVKKLSGQYGYIDLFWRGMLLAEHKSGGKDLSKAASQAFQYIQDLVNAGRQDEAPRYVLLSNFQSFVLYDLEAGTEFRFELSEFHKHVDKFAFIPGYKQQTLAAEDPINLKAVEIMGRLHDKLEAGGYKGHELERMLVRVLFCLFAEDTGIFSRNAFQFYIENHTVPDGSNLGAGLSQFFYVLNTPEDQRQSNLLEELAELPYVNGELFSEHLGFAAFNREMREELLTCTRFDWSQISPAVFGALFQSVMDPAERRQVGAHYTSERDILKVIGPLFLDGLKEELEAAGTNERKLKALHSKLAGLKLLDPACGCGNFLVVAYRELRLLELEIIKRINSNETQMLIGSDIASKIDVDQFYGIEIAEWPARIAEVAMWLMDHQMNLKISQEFGNYFVRLPLKKSPHIVCGNALHIDWNEVLLAKQCSYVFGNPPFVGHHLQKPEQKQDQLRVWHDIDGAGVLDLVTCWYRLAAEYTRKTLIECAFVSTNSIAQGEQPSIFWPKLYEIGTRITFAHRTFKLVSEARGKANVHVVIIGFSHVGSSTKRIWDYEHSDGAIGQMTSVRSITPYLFEGPEAVIPNRTKPISDIPTMRYGNKPTDDGNFILSESERDDLIMNWPESEKYVRRYIGASDFLDGKKRYCLWIPDIDPGTVKSIQPIAKRIQAVREFRLRSAAKSTREYAAYPTRFRQIAQTNEPFILVPRHTSEKREYIPFAYFGPEVIPSDACFFIPNASLYHFGVISSKSHMAWVRQFCGRIKSDFRYSKDILYNNFPWPQDVSDKQRELVESKAQAVVDARAQFPDATLADLYDPLTMPAVLTKAHQELDRAVDKCYRPQPFTSDRQRVEYLFKLYEELSKPLVAQKKPMRRAKKLDD